MRNETFAHRALRGAGVATIESVTCRWVECMSRDKKLAELARSLHRAAERLWLRVANPGDYLITEADIQALQKANTDLNRAITKLKMKARK